LSVNPKVKIYAPKEGFGIYGSSLPSSFYRKDESLSPEMRYYDGKPPEIMKFGTAWQDANFELIDKTTEVVPGITLIALVSDTPGTRELKELSLAFNTPDGVVLLVGCSHPGIEKIVEAAAAINPKIRLIAGGFHLVVAPDEVIAKAVAALKDTFKVEKVAPGHCTGEPTFAALKQAFGDRYIYAGLGTTLPLADAGHRRGEDPALEGSDLATYRRLAAREDPFGLRAWHLRKQIAPL
jgi:7,8-dihydropterin-6-yl-methyl-4-(beta-D-ribofuranosyl)aminobenzene 5'-phosphate synthase